MGQIGELRMDWSYVAGFFDGEGCVHISRKGSVRVIVGNKNKEVLEQLCRFTGLGYVISEVKKHHAIPFDFHSHLILRHEDVERFLKAILPYIVVKRNVVENALQFIKSKDWRGEKTSWQEFRRVSPERLRYLHNEHKMSFSGMARFYGIAKSTVFERMKKEGIQSPRKPWIVHDPVTGRFSGKDQPIRVKS